jgi:type I restriction enzyme S subunit
MSDTLSPSKGEWNETTLGELTTKIGSGATPRGGSNSYKDEGISLIRSQNVLDLQFTTDGLAFIDDEQADGLKNVIVEEKDVLLNITGDSVARVCMVPNFVLPARVNQHVSIIRADTERTLPEYLLYNLISQKEELLMQSEIGATRKAITKGMIEQFELKIPPFEEQRAIASVLSSLDDKIDLLHPQKPNPGENGGDTVSAVVSATRRPRCGAPH